LKDAQSVVHNNCNSEKYEHAFQEFISNSIERSKLAYIIYGVSRKKLKCIGYTSDEHKTLWLWCCV